MLREHWVSMWRAVLLEGELSVDLLVGDPWLLDIQSDCVETRESKG